ncbi:MAG: hypothetical protein DDT26_01958 [Dehalococcoidia bacterium]|nr:hypothetical protein [Chloroflexota bacterium]
MLKDSDTLCLTFTGTDLQVLGVDNKEAMLKMREWGWTYQAIANLIGISRQRVHQILNGNEKYRTSKNKRWRERYRYARIKGFTSQEATNLKSRSKKIIDQLAKEKEQNKC